MDPVSRSVHVSTTKKLKILEMGHLTLAEKQGILDLYKQITDTKTKMKKTAVIAKIVDTVGVARSTVYRVIKEHKETGKIRSPRKEGGRPAMVANVDEYVRNSIREIIQGFFNQNEAPTVDKILNKMKARPELPKMSRSSLYNLMKQINIK